MRFNTSNSLFTSFEVPEKFSGMTFHCLFRSFSNEQRLSSIVSYNLDCHQSFLLLSFHNLPVQSLPPYGSSNSPWHSFNSSFRHIFKASATNSFPDSDADPNPSLLYVNPLSSCQSAWTILRDLQNKMLVGFFDIASVNVVIQMTDKKASLLRIKGSSNVLLIFTDSIGSMSSTLNTLHLWDI